MHLNVPHYIVWDNYVDATNDPQWLIRCKLIYLKYVITTGKYT